MKPKFSERNIIDISPGREKILLICILAISSVFRLLAAFRLSLSNDELSALTRARHDSFGEMILKGVYIDFHPAGVESFIYFWIKFFGDNPFVYRLPFVLCGILSVYLIYILGKKWFSSFTGLCSASLFSVFQFSILYSFFARPYSPGLLAALVASYAWSNILFSKDERRSKREENLWYLIFTLSMIACTHIHYFSLVFAASLGIAGLVFLRRNMRLKYLISGIVVLLAFIPELSIFREQIKTGDIGGWLAAPDTWYLAGFFSHVLNDSTGLAILFFLFSFLGSVILIRSGHWSKFHSLSLFLFLFSFCIAYLYSVLRHPVIQYSTMYFTLPFLLFIISNSIEMVISKWNKSWLILPAFLLTGMVSTLFGKELFTRAQYGVFKDIAEDIDQWKNEYGNDNVRVMINVINPEYVNYYFRLLHTEPEVIWKVESREQLNKLPELLDSLKAPYICFAWSNSYHPYEIIRILRDKYPVLLKKHAFFNSASYLFAISGSSVAADPLMKIIYEPQKKEWLDDKDSPVPSDGTLNIDSTMAFSPGYQCKLQDLPGKNFRLLSSSFSYRATDQSTAASVVISIDSAGVPVRYFDLQLDECNPVPGQWQDVYFTREIPDDVSKDFTINTYLYNKNFSSFELKNYRITLESWDDPYKPGD